jgi:hypothetical protein
MPVDCFPDEQLGAAWFVQIQLDGGDTVESDQRSTVSASATTKAPSLVSVRTTGEPDAFAAPGDDRGLAIQLQVDCASPCSCRSVGEELEQRFVDLLGVRPADVVRSALDGNQFQVCDQLG